MPAYDVETIPQHGCCKPARFRRRAQCICNCHDMRVTDYTRFAPAATDFGRTQLRWHVRTDDRRQRTVGMVIERMPKGCASGGGYYVSFASMGPRVIVEDPWYGVGILSAWSQTGREHNLDAAGISH
jgi:hypothetical protein